MAFSVPLSETSNSLGSLPGTTKAQLEAEDWGGVGWRVTQKLSPEPPSPPCVYKTIQRF